MSFLAAQVILTGIITLVIILPTALSHGTDPIPTDKALLNSWFDRSLAQISSVLATKQSVVGTGLAGPAKLIRVRADGTGDFKTITEAVESIPNDNTCRIIVSIGPGNYTEKVKINRYKPFITFYGDPVSRPVLVYNGTALQYGTADSGTLIVESDYFTAANLIIVNSAPRPDGKMKDAMAVAMRIMGDYAAFFNCCFHGFQDTLMDDMGHHLYKDCYIEGTVDFIFGSGQTIYLNTEIHVIPGDPMAIITASARETPEETKGYIFVHCNVTGSGRTAYLGRSWFDYARVIFAYCDMSDVVHPDGWSNNNKPETNNTVFFGEFNNRGPGANMTCRPPFVKRTEAEIQPFLSLAYIEAAEWLQLPPANLQALEASIPLPTSTQPGGTVPQPGTAGPIPTFPQPGNIQLPKGPQPGNVQLPTTSQPTAGKV